MTDTIRPISSRDINELNEVRATLVDQIHETRTSPNVPRRDYDQLHPLEIQYNTVVNQMCSLSRGPLSDPLDVLPEEIWEQIVYEATSGVSFYWTDGLVYVKIDEILPLTAVSIKWRNTIINNPRFWSTIEIRDQVEDQEAKIQLAITLSKDFPLAVICGNGWDRFGHYIIGQSFRVRSLILGFGNMNKILVSIGKAPLLEHLHVGMKVEPSNLVSFIGTANSIRSITGNSYLSLEILTASSIKQIRRLDIIDGSGEYLPSLESLRYLEHLTYCSDTRMGPYPLKIGSGSLPWKYLNFFGRFTGCGEHLFKGIASTIVHLILLLSLENTSDFLVHCSNMPLLRLLTLKLTMHMQDDKPAVIRRQDLPSSKIQNLHIINPHPSLPISRANFNTLFENFTSMAPNVQHLRCRGSSESFAPFHIYATSLKRLKNMELFLEKKVPSDELERNFGVLSTQKLILKGGACLKSFRTTGVLNLEVESWENKLGLAGLLKSNEWQNLHKIHFPEWASDWEGVSLPHVTKISFNRGNESTEIGRGLSSFCQEIAIHPTIFPSLEQLGGDIPEWDILFIMLERRNVFSSAKVACIKSIKLVPLPSIVILKPLVKLLGGRFTIRSANYEISLAGIARAYFEPKSHGCIRCTRVFRPCKGRRPQPMPLFLPEQLFTYPGSPKEILSTRVDRLRQWSSMVDTPNALAMANTCTSVVGYGGVEVTEHFLDGVSFDEI